MSADLFVENQRHLEPARNGTVSVLPFERLVELMGARLSGLSLTAGEQEWATPFTAVDMAWNHMDFAHRPYVHRQYERGLRIALGKDVGVGFTQFARDLLMIPTFDVRVADGEFLHGYCIAGLVYVFLRIRILPGGEARNDYRLDWVVASKGWLRWLHGPLHRKIRRLNQRLFDEDVPIKTERRRLREAGYRFQNDDPDLLESSRLFPTNVVPPAAEPVRVALALLPADADEVVATGPRRFLVRRAADGSVLVWDAVCPHQGGPLAPDASCATSRRCPWHGLDVPGLRLSADAAEGRRGSFSARLADGELSILPSG